MCLLNSPHIYRSFLSLKSVNLPNTLIGSELLWSVNQRHTSLVNWPQHFRTHLIPRDFRHRCCWAGPSRCESEGRKARPWSWHSPPYRCTDQRASPRNPARQSCRRSHSGIGRISVGHTHTYVISFKGKTKQTHTGRVGKTDKHRQMDENVMGWWIDRVSLACHSRPVQK